MFDSLFVPLDFRPADERALATARIVAEAGPLPVEVVTVASQPGDHTWDRHRLEGAAELLGDLAWSAQVLEGGDVAEAVVAAVAGRPATLPVVATHAFGSRSGRAVAAAGEALLAELARPVLMVGPEVRTPVTPPAGLVVAVAGPGALGAAEPWVRRWAGAFGGDVWFVHAGGRDGGEATLEAAADRLAALGVAARWQVLDAGDPVEALLRFTARHPGCVPAAVTARWTGADGWGSTTRRLVRRAAEPVLVVPAPAPAPAEGDRTAGAAARSTAASSARPTA